MSLRGIIGTLLIGLMLSSVPVIAQVEPLQQAIQDYEQENYEEALQLLEALRAEQENAEISYYLGLTHAKMGDAEQTTRHLEEAHRLGKNNKALYLELASATLAQSRPQKSREWLEKAEAAGFEGGEISLLRGISFSREKRLDEAHRAFDQAVEQTPSLLAKVDYLRAQLYVADNDYDKAQQVLQNIINTAPESDLAEAAREYNRQYTKLKSAYRAWGGRIQLGYLYDSNAIAEPEQTIPGLPDAEDHALNGRIRLEYLPRTEGRLLFSGRYDLNATIYDENSTSDQLEHRVSLSPGYRLDGLTFTLPVAYTHTSRDGDAYQQTVAVNPTVNFYLNKSNVVQFLVGYSHRNMLFDYVNATTESLESREGGTYQGQLGYYYLFAAGRGMANLRYVYSDEDADGEHWDHQGHRVAASGVLPLSERLSADALAEVEFMEFDNRNTIFNEDRSDAVKNFSAGLSWELYPNSWLFTRYHYTRADSNVYLYEYRRHLGMLGVEFSF